MTTETADPNAAPTADMLIKPRMTPDPSPLRVSTFAQPEYAKLTFLYGKGADVSPTRKVYCRKFVVRIPTGLQAGALTAEPELIRHDLTVTGGDGHDWRIDKDRRDPNQVVFTCLPAFGDVAVFDGTWQIRLELWGIEVNTGVGPVGILFEEETSLTGNTDWVVRTGRGEVPKRDDSFEFHSFRPATTVIGYNTTVKLDWIGTANAIYTMSYRNAAGVNTSVSVSDGTWTTPATAPLKQHTDFILKAAFGGKDYFLTTSVEVKDPEIIATTVTAKGLIKANGSIEVNGEPDGGVRNGYLWIRKGARLDLEESTTANVESAKLNAFGPVTVKGPLTANGALAANDGVTLGVNKNLTIPEGTGKLIVAGSFEAQAYKSGTNWGKVKVLKVLTVGDIGDSESNAYGLYVAVPVRSDMTFDAARTLTVSKIKGTGTYTELVLDGITRIDGSLRGPGGGSTAPVVIPGPLTVGGTLEGQWIKPARGITVPSGQAIYVNGKRVLADGDALDLRITTANGQNTWYLYCTFGSGHHAAGPYVVGGAEGYTNSRWYVRYRGSSALGMDESDDPTGPDDTESLPSE